MFPGELKFVDCPTHEIYKIKCPTNKTMIAQYIGYVWGYNHIFVHRLCCHLECLHFCAFNLIGLGAEDSSSSAYYSREYVKYIKNKYI